MYVCVDVQCNLLNAFPKMGYGKNGPLLLAQGCNPTLSTGASANRENREAAPFSPLPPVDQKQSFFGTVRGRETVIK
jgi:hypothetical protein